MSSGLLQMLCQLPRLQASLEPMLKTINLQGMTPLGVAHFHGHTDTASHLAGIAAQMAGSDNGSVLSRPSRKAPRPHPYQGKSAARARLAQLPEDESDPFDTNTSLPDSVSPPDSNF